MKHSNNHLLLNFIICFLGFGAPMGLFCSLLFCSIIKGMILGFLGGLLFAVMMMAFVIILSARKHKLRERYGITGQVMYDGAANFMRNKLAIGGWIFLTDTQFCFLPHLINSSIQSCILSYDDITDVTNGKMIRSIAVHTQDNNSYEFVVNNRQKWIRILKQMTQK